jgi:hypothetical protein
MRSLTREGVLVVLLSAVPITSCSGLISPEASTATRDGGVIDEDPTSSSSRDASIRDPSLPDISTPDAYGAQFQGDAGQCAAVICSGAQVCCVVPIPSDAPTPHPNNRCDYDCTAQCMDSCPVIALGSAGAASSPGDMGSMHGGAVVLPADDAGVD